MLLIEIICILIFLFSATRLFLIYQDYHRASEEYENLSEEMLVILEEQKADAEVAKSVEHDIPDYYVNLDVIKKKNSDAIGWIILPDSKINYPILWSKDNTEYLTTTFEGQKSSSGAIFVDMLCEGDFNSQNTIIYGHNMKNGSMFRALNDLTDKTYFENHHIFCIDTGSGFEMYEIIACYATDSSDAASWQISFDSEESYALWLQERAKRCTYECAPYDIEKSTITLSTCRGKVNGTGRFVVYLQKKDK